MVHGQKMHIEQEFFGTLETFRALWKSKATHILYSNISYLIQGRNTNTYNIAFGQKLILII